MVNKGRIHGEIRDFQEIFWNSIKSDDELRWEIRENDRFGKKTQKRIHGTKIHSISIKFTEKSMSELDTNFWTRIKRNPKLKD